MRAPVFAGIAALGWLAVSLQLSRPAQASRNPISRWSTRDVEHFFGSLGTEFNAARDAVDGKTLLKLAEFYPSIARLDLGMPELQFFRMKDAMDRQYIDTPLCIRGQNVCLEAGQPGFNDWAEIYMLIQQYGRNNSDVSVLHRLNDLCCRPKCEALAHRCAARTCACARAHTRACCLRLCTRMHGTAPHRTARQHRTAAPHGAAPRHAAPHRTAPHRTAHVHGTSPHCTAWHGTARQQRTALHCTAPHRAAPRRTHARHVRTQPIRATCTTNTCAPACAHQVLHEELLKASQDFCLGVYLVFNYSELTSALADRSNC